MATLTLRQSTSSKPLDIQVTSVTFGLEDTDANLDHTRGINHFQEPLTSTHAAISHLPPW
jgi:hypothetical protein